jgi:hypothetical protein
MRTYYTSNQSRATFSKFVDSILGTNQLIAFINDYESLRNAHETPFNYEKQDFRFSSQATAQEKFARKSKSERSSTKACEGKNRSSSASPKKPKKGGKSPHANKQKVRRSNARPQWKLKMLAAMQKALGIFTELYLV